MICCARAMRAVLAMVFVLSPATVIRECHWRIDTRKLFITDVVRSTTHSHGTQNLEYGYGLQCRVSVSLCLCHSSNVGYHHTILFAVALVNNIFFEMKTCYNIQIRQKKTNTQRQKMTTKKKEEPQHSCTKRQPKNVRRRRLFVCNSFFYYSYYFVRTSCSLVAIWFQHCLQSVSILSWQEGDRTDACRWIPSHAFDTLTSETHIRQTQASSAFSAT